MNLSALGEDEFLELLRDWTADSPGPVVLGPGDDAALVDVGGDEQLVVSTDAYREGVHFDRDYLKPDEIGQRAMAGALSDLAAMGANGVAAFVNLHAPRQTSIAFLRGLYLGLSRVGGAHGVSVGGGDTVRARTLAIGITALGTVPRGKALLRSGAAALDVICVSGELGASEAGRLLLSGAIAEEFPHGLRAEAEAAHRFPRPRFEVARLLMGLTRRTVDLELTTETVDPVRPTAAMDISDGLAIDLRRLCAASRVGCRIEERLVPVSGVARRVARLRGEPESALALGGGEDYELLFTMKSDDVDVVQKAASAAGLTISRIGFILPESDGLWLEREDGTERELPVVGYDHFLDRGDTPARLDA